MSEKRTDELYRVLQRKGYPDDFCREIAYKQMNTDYTAMRMLGYLYRISDPRPEDVVDEMLAILSDRNAIIQKKEMEHAQATMNRVYKDGLDNLDQTAKLRDTTIQNNIENVMQYLLKTWYSILFQKLVKQSKNNRKRAKNYGTTNYA